MHNPGCPTDKDLPIAYTYRSTVISARAEEGEYCYLNWPYCAETLAAVAPPWFNEAMRATLEPLEDRIDQVKIGMRETARTTNMVFSHRSPYRGIVSNFIPPQLYSLLCQDGRLVPHKVVQFLDGTSCQCVFPSFHLALTCGMSSGFIAQGIRRLESWSPRFKKIHGWV